MSRLLSLVGTVLLLVMIAVTVPLTLPNLMGYHIYQVVSGSMEPEIPVGSLVYIQDGDPEDALDGEVIAFYGVTDASAIITHRLIENRVTMGEMITKGDANEINDINPVPYDHYIGRVVLSLPNVGVVAALITSREGKFYAAGVIVAALLLHAAATLLDKRRGL